MNIFTLAVVVISLSGVAALADWQSDESTQNTKIDTALTTVAPTVSTIAPALQADKELMLAAAPDAVAFLAQDANGQKSTLLTAAMKNLSLDPKLAALSDEEKAQAIVYLAEQDSN